MKLLNSRQMQALDREAIESLGIPSIVLMENAARALSAELACRYPLDDYPNILSLAGKGNNGGDALAAARILSGQGYRVSIVLLCDESELKTDAATQFRICRKLSLSVKTGLDAAGLRRFIHTEIGNPEKTVLIDGLFGVGLKRPVESGFWADLIDVVNEFSGPVVSVDLPSGILEEENPAGKRVRADLTVTLQEPKIALIREENRSYAGKVRIVDIGIPQALYVSRPEFITWIDHSAIVPFLEDMMAFAHKNQFGHGLAIVGSERMPGAGVLAVASALRGGIGLCTAMVPPTLGDLFVSSCPEALLLFRGDRMDLNRYAAVLIGPGLGREADAVSLLRQVMAEYRGVLVLDADALNILADSGLERKDFDPGVKLILTPHSGEMARLLGMERSRVESDRIKAVTELARRFQATVVLKGRYSLVATAGREISVNPTGNSGMATGGSGDVLAGLTMALAGRFGGRFPLHHIVCAAVWLHGRSGDLAVKEKGRISLSPRDLIEYLPQAMLGCERNDIEI